MESAHKVKELFRLYSEKSDLKRRRVFRPCAVSDFFWFKSLLADYYQISGSAFSKRRSMSVFLVLNRPKNIIHLLIYLKRFLYCIIKKVKNVYLSL